jgi:hypothetical protein
VRSGGTGVNVAVGWIGVAVGFAILGVTVVKGLARTEGIGDTAAGVVFVPTMAENATTIHENTCFTKEIMIHKINQKYYNVNYVIRAAHVRAIQTVPVIYRAEQGTRVALRTGEVEDTATGDVVVLLVSA